MIKHDTEAKTLKPRFQKRGTKRREYIATCTRRLLENTDLESITLSEIAQNADIPISSLYNLYANIDEIYIGIVNSFREELITYLSEQSKFDTFDKWQDLIDWIIDSTAAFYSKNYAFQQLILSGKAASKIKQADRESDSLLADSLLSIVSNYFTIQPTPQLSLAIFGATQIVDLFLSLSVSEENKITEKWINEAKTASKAYLRSYWPEYLPTK